MHGAFVQIHCLRQQFQGLPAQLFNRKSEFRRNAPRHLNFPQYLTLIPNGPWISNQSEDGRLAIARGFSLPKATSSQRSLLPAPRVDLVPDLKRTSGEISHTQWESARSLIWRFYVVENKPYKHVALILQREYGFHPT
jgi:hypothetical protein